MIVRLFLSLGLIVGLSSCLGPKARFEAQEPPKIVRTIVPPPQHLAVLLPLNGKGDLGAVSKAIIDGIMLMHTQHGSQGQIVLRVLDSSRGEITALYQQAIASGAEMVIGPLTKAEVSALRSSELPVPVLALNTLDDYHLKFKNNLYQFGLLPQDEAIQAALKMAHQQLTNVALVVPEGSWGTKVGEAFAYQYAASHGKVVATLRYRNDRSLAEQVCKFLAYDATQLCGAQARQESLYQPSVVPKRRQDLDAIFLVATNPKQARQVVSLLRYYYANDLPIYTISTIFTGVKQPEIDQDFNEVYFCDMPWVLAELGGLSTELRRLYQRQVDSIVDDQLSREFWLNYNKYYALGIDAYNLAVHFNMLLNAPQAGLVGASGILYLDNFNHIYRKLSWVQVKNGSIAL